MLIESIITKTFNDRKLHLVKSAICEVLLARPDTIRSNVDKRS